MLRFVQTITLALTVAGGLVNGGVHGHSGGTHGAGRGGSLAPAGAVTPAPGGGAADAIQPAGRSDGLAAEAAATQAAAVRAARARDAAQAAAGAAARAAAIAAAAQPGYRPTPAPPPPSGGSAGVRQIIQAAFQPLGSGAVAWAERVAMCESGDNPSAQSPSGYMGLFQFAASTWRGTPYGGQSPFSAVANARAAAWLYAHDGPGQWTCG